MHFFKVLVGLGNDGSHGLRVLAPGSVEIRQQVLGGEQGDIHVLGVEDGDAVIVLADIGGLGRNGLKVDNEALDLGVEVGQENLPVRLHVLPVLHVEEPQARVGEGIVRSCMSLEVLGEVIRRCVDHGILD